MEKWPFETHQTGWGEFEIGVRIQFKDPFEKPVDCVHMLKLYTDSQNQNSTVKKPIVSERYDEVVFKNPTEVFYEVLKAGPLVKNLQEQLPEATEEEKEAGEFTYQTVALSKEDKAKPIHHSVYAQYHTNFDDNRDYEQLQEARQFFEAEVLKLRTNLLKTNKELLEKRRDFKVLEQGEGVIHQVLQATQKN